MGKLKIILSLIYLGALYIIPYADIDVAGLLAGSVFGNLGKIPILGLPFKAISKFLTIFPYVNEIYITKLSKMQAIVFGILVLIPYVDLEGVRFLEKIGLKQMKIFQFAKGTKGAKAAKTAAKHGDEVAHEGRKELLRHGGSDHGESSEGAQRRGQRGRGRQGQQNPGNQGKRLMTDGGQPVEDDSGEDSSITDSLSFGMSMFGGSDTFTLEFRSGGVSDYNPGDGDDYDHDLEKHDEVEVKYNDDEGTLEAVDGDLAVGNWWNDEEGSSVQIEKRDGDFVPAPMDRQKVKRLAGVEEDSDSSGGSGRSGGSDGGNGGSGGSGRFGTDGGNGGGSSPGINEGTMKAVGALALVVGLIGFLYFSGWGQQLGDAAGLTSTGIDTDTQMRAVEGIIQKIQCFGSAACFRQWQMNNTEKPGSEEVGERYQLKIENFDVNDGYTLDVNRRKAESNIPVGFSVYNPRNGLKGITAEDVKYRISILGPDSDSDNPICTSGEPGDEWNELGGQFSDDNEIMPGGFATPDQELNNLNLGNCGVLQPALGINRKVELQVKYDYSSQATLYVDAMSWENLQSLGERPEFKKSETADTPVQSYVNAESPIVYRENDGDRVSDQFQVKLGFETDENNLMYRIKPGSIKFYDSSETVHVADTRCELDAPSSGNEYTVKKSTKEYLDRRVDKDDPSTWFDSVSGPSPIRCTLELEDDGRGISPTGETLNMRIEGDYTVMFEEEFTEFEIKNSACEDLGTYNCPLLLPKSEAEDSDYSNILSECSSDATVDAGNGCDVRMTSGVWHTIVGPVNAKSVDGEIEEGEAALKWEDFATNWATSGDKTTVFNAVEDAEGMDGIEDPITEPEFEGSNCPEGEDGVDGCPEKSRFGLPTDTKEDFKKLEDEYPYLVIERESDESAADIKIGEIDTDTAICTDSLTDRNIKEAVHDYLADHADSRSSDFQQLLWGQVKTGNCKSGFLEGLYDDVNIFNDGYEERKSNCETFMYAEGGDGECFVP